MIDPDQERIAAWLRGQTEVASVDAWDAIFPPGFRGSELTREQQMRMASMLRLAEWHSVVGWSHGKVRRFWIKGPDPRAKAKAGKQPTATEVAATLKRAESEMADIIAEVVLARLLPEIQEMIDRAIDGMRVPPRE